MATNLYILANTIVCFVFSCCHNFYKWRLWFVPWMLFCTMNAKKAQISTALNFIYNKYPDPLSTISGWVAGWTCTFFVISIKELYCAQCTDCQLTPSAPSIRFERKKHCPRIDTQIWPSSILSIRQSFLFGCWAQRNQNLNAYCIFELPPTLKLTP